MNHDLHEIKRKRLNIFQCYPFRKNTDVFALTHFYINFKTIVNHKERNIV